MIIDGLTVAGLVMVTAMVAFLYVLHWCRHHHTCN